MRNPENGFSFTADSGISGMSDLSDMSGITAVTTSSKDSTEKYEEKVEKYDEKVVVVERMTRKYIRKIAKRNDDILGGGEQAKHIAMLQKAERDLLLVSFCIFLTREGKEINHSNAFLRWQSSCSSSLYVVSFYSFGQQFLGLVPPR